MLADEDCANLQRAVEIGSAGDDPGRTLAARLLASLGSDARPHWGPGA